MTAKKVIIIGAAKSGYAEAITRKMIREGVAVIGSFDAEATDNVQRMQKEFSKAQLDLRQVDLACRKSLADFVKTVEGNIDGIVIAQGFFAMENPDAFDHEIWDKSIAINLTAPNFLLHELKHKMNDGSSNVILTSTEAFRGSYGASAYAATKAAMHNLVKTFANTLGKRKIRTNALPAGWIGGEMDTDEIFNKSRELTPLGRLGTAEEIADIAYFLFSDQSGFINGTALIADGGYTGSDPLAKYEFEAG